MDKIHRRIPIIVAWALLAPSAEATPPTEKGMGAGYLISYGRGRTTHQDLDSLSSSENFSLTAVCSDESPSWLDGTGMLFDIGLFNTSFKNQEDKTTKLLSNGANLGMCALTRKPVHLCIGAGLSLITVKQVEGNDSSFHFAPTWEITSPIRFGNGFAMTFAINNVYVEKNIGTRVTFFHAGVAWDVGTNSETGMFHRKKKRPEAADEL